MDWIILIGKYKCVMRLRMVSWGIMLVHWLTMQVHLILQGACEGGKTNTRYLATMSYRFFRKLKANWYQRSVISVFCVVRA